jgi:hypothetical protein
LAVVAAVFGGDSALAIYKNAEFGFGGKELISPEGRKALLKHSTELQFQHPDSNGRRHKLAKNSKLDRAKEKPPKKAGMR